MNKLTAQMNQAYEIFVELRNKVALISNTVFVQPKEIKKNLPWGRLRLNGTQINILQTLFENSHKEDSAVTIGEISKMEGILKQAVTKPIAELVRAGLVTKTKREGNLKSVYVELTDYGKQLASQQHEILHTYLRQKVYSIITLDDMKSIIKLLTDYEKFLQRFTVDEIN